MRRSFRLLLLSMILVLVGPTLAQEEYAPLKKPGKKNWIGSEYYFIYNFDKKPKLGTVIVKIQLFSKDGKRDTSLKIIGKSGMPSMRGYHDTSDVDFKLNQKGDYLMPVNVVMPGDWEVQVTFFKGDEPIFKGGILFDV